MKKEKILVTSALPYANGPIHLGHLAGAYLPADIFVRYHRLKGSDVIYICGSDEHGVPITITAEKEKISPKDVIDRFNSINKESFEKFGMSFDIYSRTSNELHHQTAKEFFQSFYKNDLLKEKKSLQFFDPAANMFLPDRYVEGTCPKCGNENARSDECENCGSLYEPAELKNPISKISGKTPLLKETSHWYFPLGDYQSQLEKYISEKDEKYGWKENVLQYCRGWFREGLQDRAVTRDLDWGVAVPLDDAKGKVLYVWFEAVLGYISATKELGNQKGDKNFWKNYWQDESTKYIAFIGKDNVVFHCIVFPAMLMAWNENNKTQYTLPANVPANEFLNFEGKKFSKSRNWGVDVIDFLKKFPADPLRYTLAANLPEMRDTDFSWREFQSRNNSELADILGNLVNRTYTFVHKHFHGVVPPLYDVMDIDNEMLNLIESYPQRVGELIEKYKIKDATLEAMNLARAANKYFNDSQPWVTIKTNAERCSTTLHICLQTIYTLAEIFSPIIPFTSEKMFRMLNAKPVKWKNAGKINLNEGHQLNKTEILFTKIEDEIIFEETALLGKSEEKSEEKNLIEYDDFMKVELKSALVLHAEKIQRSEKLLKLQVEIGSEKRQIIAGVAKSYLPEELIGKKIVVVANLKPAKLMGNESNGMLLAAQTEEGVHKVILLDDSVPSGVRIK